MDFFSLLTTYKYVALSVLAIIEGPILALASGFLIRLGYFKWLPVISILMAGDLISDTVYYYLAIKSNSEKYVRKYSRKYQSISENFELLKKLWKNHGRLTMFVGKFAYGFTAPLVVSAALSRISYRKLMEYVLPPTLVKYLLFLVIGYYSAHSYEMAERYIFLIMVYISVVVAAFIISYKQIIKYLKHKAESE